MDRLAKVGYGVLCRVHHRRGSVFQALANIAHILSGLIAELPGFTDDAVEFTLAISRIEDGSGNSGGNSHKQGWNVEAVAGFLLCAHGSFLNGLISNQVQSAYQ